MLIQAIGSFDDTKRAELLIHRLKHYDEILQLDAITTKRTKLEKPLRAGHCTMIQVLQSDIPSDMCVEQDQYWASDGATQTTYIINLESFQLDFKDKETAHEYFKTLLDDFPDDNTVIGEYNTLIGI